MVIEFRSIIVSSFVTFVTHYCIKQTGDIWLHLGGRKKFKSFQLLAFLLFKTSIIQSIDLLMTHSNPVQIDALRNLAHVNKMLKLCHGMTFSDRQKIISAKLSVQTDGGNSRSLIRINLFRQMMNRWWRAHPILRQWPSHFEKFWVTQVVTLQKEYFER